MKVREYFSPVLHAMDSWVESFSLVPWSVDEDTIDSILCEVDRIMESIIDHESDAIGLTEHGFGMAFFREVIREMDSTRVNFRKVFPDPCLCVPTMIVLIACSDDRESLSKSSESVDAIDCISVR